MAAQDLSGPMLAGVVVILALSYMWGKGKKLPTGGEADDLWDDGFRDMMDMMELPDIIDLATSTKYHIKGVKVLKKDPLKVQIRAETQVDAGLGADTRVDSFILEHGVNDPVPINPVASLCLGPKPGAWFVSNVGEIPENVPALAQVAVHEKNQRIKKIEAKAKEEVRKAEVEAASMVDKVTEILRPQQPRDKEEK